VKKEKKEEGGYIQERLSHEYALMYQYAHVFVCDQHVHVVHVPSLMVRGKRRQEETVEGGYIQEQMIREYTHMYKSVYVCVCGNHLHMYEDRRLHWRQDIFKSEWFVNVHICINLYMCVCVVIMYICMKTGDHSGGRIYSRASGS